MCRIRHVCIVPSGVAGSVAAATSGGRAGGGTQVAMVQRMRAPLTWPGPDFVHAEVTSLGLDGPFRLTVLHARGAIVEYFSDTAAALSRQGELEALLAAARGVTPMPFTRAV